MSVKSEHSIEHSLTFNTAKRVLRFVDPTLKVVASRDLSGSDSLLDLKLNMLYVPESQPLRAAGMILFYAGLMNLKFTKFKMTSVFGHINKGLDELDLIDLCSSEHAKADELAFKWGLKQFMLLYPEVEEARAHNLVDQRLTKEEWKEYFSSNP